MTGDYIDIDKLREQTRDAEPPTGPWTPFAYEDGPAPRTFVTDGQGRQHHVFSENAAQHLNQRDAAVAELVGLRTEVDQLRTENERWSGLAAGREQQLDLAGKQLAAARAERDALQAEVEELHADVERQTNRADAVELIEGRARGLAQERVAALQAQLSEMTTYRNDWQRRAQQAEQDRNDEHDRVAALQARIDAVIEFRNSLRYSNPTLQVVVTARLDAALGLVPK